MTATEVEDVLGGDPIPPGDPDEPIVEGVALFVCDHVGDDGLCSSSFDTANKLKMHKLGKHRDRSGERRTGGPKKKAGSTTGKDRKPTQAKAAASKATGQSSNRSETYAASIAMAGLGAYLVVPVFDQFDLGVVNAGAPNLATALDALGAQNETVRKTCDLILGGGSGGAYLQLVLAVSAMAVPIMAHHNLLPDSAGARFGEMVGVAPSADVSPPPHDVAPGEPGEDFLREERHAKVYDPTNIDDVQVFMTGVPPTVMADLAGRMMSGDGGPVTVDVPFYDSPTGDDSGEPGPEQPKPRVPEAEPDAVPAPT